MLPLDRALLEREREGRPIRIGLIGPGATGRMIALQLLTHPHGLRLCAISSRRAERAVAAFEAAGRRDARVAVSLDEVEERIARGEAVAVEHPELLCVASGLDVIVEVTGTVEFAARVVTQAIESRKHVVLVNAEIDCTLGPILKARADAAGVVLTNTDGDEPGVAMTLVRYLRSLGLRTVAAGNIKGMLDRYRTPETQREFAARFNQDPVKTASFADGTKLSMEAAVLANATGFPVGQRGMYGISCGHVREVAQRLPLDQLLETGLVDYTLGAEPHTGAFAIVYEDQPTKRAELSRYKLGDGPLFVFYTPYHLPHVQIVATIARAALYHDATVAPIGPPVCEVIACAKRDLRAGELLDGVGGFTTYGLIENSAQVEAERLLPIALSESCRLMRDLRRDTPIRYDDVEVPGGRLCDRLYAEQRARFSRPPVDLATSDQVRDAPLPSRQVTGTVV